MYVLFRPRKFYVGPVRVKDRNQIVNDRAQSINAQVLHFHEVHTKPSSAPEKQIQCPLGLNHTRH